MTTRNFIKKVCCFALLGVSPAVAQTVPPTSQQLQQQSNQTIQNQANATRNNTSQIGAQTPTRPSPTLSKSGRAISHPPSYIPPAGH
jgi:hypothetical protein